MIAPPQIKGWCPSLLTPMAASDGLIARIKPSRARLSAAQAQALAAAAQRWGHGGLELTRRGNLQARGLRPDTYDAFARCILELGLAVPDPAAEAVRSICCSPLTPTEDPTSTLDAPALASRLEALLVADTRLHALPGKFGISVDGGGQYGLPDETGADIAIAPHPSGAILRVGQWVRVGPIDEIPDWVQGLLLQFLHQRQQRNPSPKRMWQVADALAMGGLATGEEWHKHPAPAPIRGGANIEMAAQAFYPPFGRLTALQLTDLAAVAMAHGDGTVRLAPWRCFVLPGLDAQAARRVEDFGFISNPADPRLRIAACSGQPGCSHAHADSLADAAMFAAVLSPTVTSLHVSGCTKGCARSESAAITLTAQQGGYDLVRNGKAGDPPSQTGLDRMAVLALLQADL